MRFVKGPRNRRGLKRDQFALIAPLALFPWFPRLAIVGYRWLSLEEMRCNAHEVGARITSKMSVTLWART